MAKVSKPQHMMHMGIGQNLRPNFGTTDFSHLQYSLSQYIRVLYFSIKTEVKPDEVYNLAAQSDLELD